MNINNNRIDLKKLKQNVQQKFLEIRSALHMREKLLLRQFDVIAHQMERSNARASLSSSTDSNDNCDVKFLADHEDELLDSIRCFGRYQLDNMNLALHNVYLRQEDYITPTDDHEIMYKCLQQYGDSNVTTSDVNDVTTELLVADEQPETIVVDFSKNKSLIEHSAKNMNESIINITLQEAKELIKKAKAKREIAIPPLNLEELDDELESSIAEAVSNLGLESQTTPKVTQLYASASSSSAVCDVKTKPKKHQRFKPKITINNCNGTINLRNISSLTINCATNTSATDEAVSSDIKKQQHDHHDDNENSVSSTYHSKHCKGKKKSKATTSSTVHSTSGVAPAPHQTPPVLNAEWSTSTTTNNTASSSSYSSSQSSSRSQSKKQMKKTKATKKHNEAIPTTTTDGSNNNNSQDNNDDGGGETCNFYNRLLNEIKQHTVMEKSKRIYVGGATTAGTSAFYEEDAGCIYASTPSSSSQQQQQPNKRLILRNFENLKIVLQSNKSGDEDSLHPIQIEQWLAEIISETDLEPMQNTDILEHSKINNETME